ncbi:MAG: ATP-binding protein [Magnetococcus sp. YQC-3]
MHLPALITECLHRDPALHGAVNVAVGQFAPFLREETPPFFPEYTDHGMRHNEEVIKTAVALMTERAAEIFSPQDAAILVLSVLLHDCAMHITADGFFHLIKEGSIWQPVLGFADKPWSILWDGFIAEAVRFDGQTLRKLFGTPDSVGRPPDDPIHMTQRDRMLIGEFLRRHHARLAHEIALYGFPGADGLPIVLLSGIDEDWQQLAGVTARSHGMAIRDCLKFLDEYDRRDFQGAHVVFVMVLLRLADYFQIQPQRAPKEVLRVKKIRSGISQAEWRTHHCIRNIAWSDEDPEAIYIKGSPKEVATYLRVKSWLDGIQQELDGCWAILGELYGRYGDRELDKLGIRLRRVRSNMDEWQEFSKSIDYVPEKICFASSGPDLLKLLVGPLYGENPGIAVRELVQNAVDAVREADAWCEKRPDAVASRRSLRADVVATLHYEGDLPARFVIEDRGIGMSLEVIKNYFLKAGASFRKSDAWKREFADEQGHAILPRSGRFGVGALAAFLLGDEIEVETRHIAEERGLSFVATLDSSELTLKWCDCPVGTKISIKISDRNAQWIAARGDGDSSDGKNGWWDYYHDPVPSLRREVFPDGRVFTSLFVLPDEENCWKIGWRLIQCTPYQAIFWTYNDAPSLSCNGISICEEGLFVSSIGNQWTLNKNTSIDFPKLSIIDHNGHLPLNLQRTKLTVPGLSFEKELFDSVANDFIANLLVTLPKSYTSVNELYFFNNLLDFSFLGALVIVTRGGVILNDSNSAEFENIISLLAVDGCFPVNLLDSDMQSAMAIKDNNFRTSLSSYYDEVCRFASGKWFYKYSCAFFSEKNAIGWVIFIRKIKGVTIDDFPDVDCLWEERGEEWFLLENGQCDQDRKEAIWQWIQAEGDQCTVVAEAYLKQGTLSGSPSPLRDAWMNILGTHMIPFDPEARRVLYERAYDKLKNHIILHEEKLACYRRQGGGTPVRIRLLSRLQRAFIHKGRKKGSGSTNPN